MDLGLAGKKAVITAATRGIGRAVANLLADEGVDVAICARNQEEVDAAVSDLRARGVKATGAAIDAADKAAYQGWITAAASELGGIDILIPCASGKGGKFDEEGWKLNFELDLLGTTRAVEAALPSLKTSKSGVIVCIGSTSAVEDFAGAQTYNAMKAAVIVHASQLAKALAPEGIRVNCISPGPTMVKGGDWEMIKAHLPDFYNATLAAHPMGRLGTPEEIANAVVFLASPAASWITGANVVADGGFTKRVQL